MNKYEIKKILTVNYNVTLKECEKILISEDYCLGILNENEEIKSFVIQEDLRKALNFKLDNYPVCLIATLTDCIDIDANNINESKLAKYIKTGLNKGIFIGKDRKNIKFLTVSKNLTVNEEEKYLTEEYKNDIPPKIRKALKYCYIAADKISLPIYLIGGIVRDIVISQENNKNLCLDDHFFDIDITVEESAIEFSRFLIKEYPEVCRIKGLHEDFKTSKVSFLIDGESIDLDIASTRKEDYLMPAHLPAVKDIGCGIYDDLIRRDFTINSMALSLNQNSFCRLIDPLGGYSDIMDKKIRILHPISFVDDPTRIIRAIKFSTRFNYRLEDATRKLMEACLDSNLFNNLGGERIKSEIKQTFNLNKSDGFNMFIDEKAYKLVDADIIIPKNISSLSQECRYLIQKYCDLLHSKDFIWLIYLGILFSAFDKQKIIEIASKMYISGMETEILTGTKDILNKTTFLEAAETRFETYELLEGYFTESLLTAVVCTNNSAVKEKITLYIDELKDIKIYTTGKDLIKAGLVSGPAFGEILRELLQARINGFVLTKEDEAEYIKKFIDKSSMN